MKKFVLACLLFLIYLLGTPALAQRQFFLNDDLKNREVFFIDWVRTNNEANGIWKSLKIIENKLYSANFTVRAKFAKNFASIIVNKAVMNGEIKGKNLVVAIPLQSGFLENTIFTPSSINQFNSVLSKYKKIESDLQLQAKKLDLAVKEVQKLTGQIGEDIQGIRQMSSEQNEYFFALDTMIEDFSIYFDHRVSPRVDIKGFKLFMTSLYSIKDTFFQFQEKVNLRTGQISCVDKSDLYVLGKNTIEEFSFLQKDFDNGLKDFDAKTNVIFKMTTEVFGIIISDSLKIEALLKLYPEITQQYVPPYKSKELMQEKPIFLAAMKKKIDDYRVKLQNFYNFSITRTSEKLENIKTWVNEFDKCP